MTKAEQENKIAENDVSILDRESVEALLEDSKENLVEHGTLGPTLFLRFEDGDVIHVPLDLPENHRERRTKFVLMGRTIRLSKQIVREAIFLYDAWYVKEESDSGIPVKEHPNRETAIFLVGRDVSNTRTVGIIQPYLPTGPNLILFGKTLKSYNQPLPQGDPQVALLNDLFRSIDGLLH